MQREGEVPAGTGDGRNRECNGHVAGLPPACLLCFRRPARRRRHPRRCRPARPTPKWPTLPPRKWRYRAGKASGDADEAIAAADTLLQIPREILSRKDPRLFDAVVVCERYRLARPGGAPPTADPQLARACQPIDRRYAAETAAIRANLQARVAGDDLATVAQSAPARP
jgi:hypothetical protein